VQKYKVLILISLTIVILDQLTKAVIANYLILHQSIEIIGGFFNITYIRNPGAAFGLFHDSGEVFRTIFLIGVSIVALGAIFFVYRRVKANLPACIALSLIAGGAIGNLVDRIRFGEVTDFLDFYIGQYHWPAFNVADSAITIGVFLAIFFFKESKGN